ncbi:RICIN domain-containing protein, partial [Streptomyces sp. NPDC002787]
APPASSAPPQTTEPESDSGSGDGSGGGGSGGGAGEQKKKAPSVLPASNVMLWNPTTKMCASLPQPEGQAVDRVKQSTCDESATGDQRWNLEVKYPRLGPGGAPLFQIRNVKNQLCVDLSDYGAKPIRSPILEYPCDGTTADNQLWWLDKQESGYYWIRNYASDNECLDVAGYSTGGDGTNLTLFTCSNTDDQEWRIIRPSED